MTPFGYHTVNHTTVLWLHDIRKHFLVLWSIISVFNIAQQRMPTILNDLRAKYFIIVDMAATVYIGINLERDYVHRTVKLYMPSYRRMALHRFQHVLRGGKEYSPYICAPIQYGKKVIM